jgi:hypothetical protein
MPGGGYDIGASFSGSSSSGASNASAFSVNDNSGGGNIVLWIVGAAAALVLVWILLRK